MLGLGEQESDMWAGRAQRGSIYVYSWQEAVLDNGQMATDHLQGVHARMRKINAPSKDQSVASKPLEGDHGDNWGEQFDDGRADGAWWSSRHGLIRPFSSGRWTAFQWLGAFLLDCVVDAAFIKSIVWMDGLGLGLIRLFPLDDELALAFSVADPVVAHVDGFGTLLLDCFVDDAFSKSIVSLDGRGRLWMP